MCIGFLKNKWKDFEPNEEYLKIVGKLNTVTKLLKYLEQFKPKAEKGWNDYWKTPWEFINNKDEPNDCEDFSIFAIDVLVRVIGIKDARLVISSGYDLSKWKGAKCHAIAVFPYQGKLAVFDFNKLYTGLNSYESAARITFPDGLRSLKMWDSQGNVLSKKRQWIGTF